MVQFHVVLWSKALIQTIFGLEHVRFSSLVLSKKRLYIFCESDCSCEWSFQHARGVPEFMTPQKMSFQFPAASETQCSQETFLLIFPELIWLVPARDHFLASSFFTSLTHTAWRVKRTNPWPTWGCRAKISMGSWRYSGSTHTTGVLLWVDTVSAAWAGQEEEEEEEEEFQLRWEQLVHMELST